MAPGQVFIVEGGAGWRRAAVAAMRNHGMSAAQVISEDDLLNEIAHRPAGPGCVLVGARSWNRSAPQLIAVFKASPTPLPVIVLCARNEGWLGLESLRAGAFEVLRLPVEQDALISAVRSAMDKSRAALANARLIEKFDRKFGRLTDREREVLPALITGRTSKEIARGIGISHRTVEGHRLSILEKFEMRSVVELVYALCEFMSTLRDDQTATLPGEAENRWTERVAIEPPAADRDE